MHLWDHLVPQATKTLNLLRRSRIHPHLSAYAQVYGHFDFNRTPLAPPGIKVLIHKEPSTLGTWSPHAVSGWYLGPAMQHYRCYRVWAQATRAERITNTLAWLPLHVAMPVLSPTERLIQAAHDLTDALLQHQRPVGQHLPAPDPTQKSSPISPRPCTDHIHHRHP
jgi:hypothetical protein